MDVSGQRILFTASATLLSVLHAMVWLIGEIVPIVGYCFKSSLIKSILEWTSPDCFRRLHEQTLGFRWSFGPLVERESVKTFTW